MYQKQQQQGLRDLLTKVKSYEGNLKEFYTEALITSNKESITGYSNFIDEVKSEIKKVEKELRTWQQFKNDLVSGTDLEKDVVNKLFTTFVEQVQNEFATITEINSSLIINIVEIIAKMEDERTIFNEKINVEDNSEIINTQYKHFLKYWNDQLNNAMLANTQYEKQIAEFNENIKNVGVEAFTENNVVTLEKLLEGHKETLADTEKVKRELYITISHFVRGK